MYWLTKFLVEALVLGTVMKPLSNFYCCLSEHPELTSVLEVIYSSMCVLQTMHMFHASCIEIIFKMKNKKCIMVFS